jgi:hypothetical protein
MADVNIVDRYLEEEKIIPAIDQIEAYINKVKIEITKGVIPETTGQNLINKATNLITLIKC